MITYDNSLCDKCGVCLITCHEHCIKLTEGGISIDHEICSTCTHCIAVCHKQAISWNRIPPKRIDRELLPTPQQLREFLQSRRSDFHFKDTPIDRELLKEIAIMGKYSPTNNYEMDVVIVDDRKIIDQLEGLCMKKVRLIDSLIFRFKPMTLLAKWIDPAFKKDEAKIKASRTNPGMFSGATALMVVVGDPRVMYTDLSAQYFIYNMQLYAKSLGIGSRPSGGGKWFLTKNAAARKLLRIPSNKSIQAILFLGYPSIEYCNSAQGLAPGIWFA